ncbi:MAG: pilus assembly protein PilM [Phycisphaerae bacterium]
MDGPQTAWGIDVGHCTLKALKLRGARDGAEVETLHVIEHSTILSQAEHDRAGLLRETVGRLPHLADLSGSRVIVSVPSRDSVSRFVRLPPVASEAVADLVRFEARQQVPFPIDQAIWRWQAFRCPDRSDAPDGAGSREAAVAIFALRRRDVHEMLDLFSETDIRLDAIQMRPAALYNLMIADGQTVDDGATLLADLGAESIEFVVAEEGRIWTHTVEFGASRLTEALARAMDVPLDEAERLKRAAAGGGEDAERVREGVEITVSELALEFRRCVDNYGAIPGVSAIKRVLAAGGGFRLPGLREAIERCLDIHVTGIERYNRIAVPPTAEAAAFRDGPGAFAVASGLALQGLGQAAVDVNFLPSNADDERRKSEGSAIQSVRRVAGRLLGRLRRH